MSDVSKKGILARRGSAVVACLAIGIAGVAWSGCGGSGDAKSVEEKVQNGLTEAETSVEKGFEEANKSLGKKNKKAEETLEKAEEATKEGLKKGHESAKQVTEEVEKAQEEYGTP